MGNKDNWYLLDTIQIPSVFAFNIIDVQVFNIFNTYSTYSKRILRIQNVFNVLNVIYL